MTLSIKSKKCNLMLKNISLQSKIRSSTSLINKMLLMRVNNNYMKLIKKTPMSLIKNILSLRDMRTSKVLYQSKMNLKLMSNKSTKKPNKNLRKIKKKRKKLRNLLKKKKKRKHPLMPNKLE